jgi:hypothetical protein
MGRGIVSALVAGVCVVALTGCGGDHPAPAAPGAPSGSSTQPAVASVTGLSVSGSPPEVGTTAQYTATATLSNGTTQNVTTQSTWQSSNTAVATVSASGVATGMGLGIADVRATYQGVTAVTQVNVSTIAPGRFAISTSASQGWSSIEVFVNGRSIGTLRRFVEPEVPTSCTEVAETRVVTSIAPGPLTYSARSDRGASWNGTAEVRANGCSEIRLTCENRNCTPASAPTPPTPPVPTPTPTPPPAPSPSTAFHVWGGPGYTQYLGFFTCVFCTEFGADSINNEFGRYGSQFSSTSMRNEFSQYGSEFSTYSACNQFASTPPRVYNANRSTYYGELTLNQFRGDAIKAATIVNWLTGSVCRH